MNNLQIFLLNHNEAVQMITGFLYYWALLCIGTCLPLITWKLWRNTIRGLISAESPYYELDENAPKESNPKRESAKDQ
jgi:hypothetical protein